MNGTFYADYTKRGSTWTRLAEAKVRDRFGMSALIKTKFLSGGEAVDWMMYAGEFVRQFNTEKGKTRAVETENALYKFVVKQNRVVFNSWSPGRSTRTPLKYLSPKDLTWRKPGVCAYIDGRFSLLEERDGQWVVLGYYE